MRSKFIIEALAFHMFETRNAFDDSPSVMANNCPVGAVIVACCAVGFYYSFSAFCISRATRQIKHTFNLWSSGTYNKQQESVKFLADYSPTQFYYSTQLFAFLWPEAMDAVLKCSRLDASKATIELFAFDNFDFSDVEWYWFPKKENVWFWKLTNSCALNSQLFAFGINGIRIFSSHK